MRAHADVSPLFWTRGTGKRLRGNKPAQVLAFYLMTAPGASMIGIFHLTIPTMVHETGLSEAEVRAALKVLAKEDFAHFDEEEELVWLPAGARTQVGEKLSPGDKRRPQVVRALTAVGAHRFVQDFVSRYGAQYDLSCMPHARKAEGGSKVLACPPDPDPASAPEPVPEPEVVVAQTPNEPEPPVDPDRKIPCPKDLDLTEDQHGQLEMNRAIPEWARTIMIADLKAKWVGFGPNKWRSLDSWRTSLVSAISRDWSDQNKRPRKPDADPEAEAARKRAIVAEREAEMRAEDAARVAAKAAQAGSQRAPRPGAEQAAALSRMGVR